MTIYEWIFYGICRIFMSNDEYVRMRHGKDALGNYEPRKYERDTTRHNKWGS